MIGIALENTCPNLRSIKFIIGKPNSHSSPPQLLLSPGLTYSWIFSCLQHLIAFCQSALIKPGNPKAVPPGSLEEGLGGKFKASNLQGTTTKLFLDPEHLFCRRAEYKLEEEDH